MEEELNEKGIEFLLKNFKGLENSEEVMHHSHGNLNPRERIKKYIDTLEKTHSNEKVINLLKRFYHNKYLIKEENIPNSLNKKEIIEIQKKSLDKWINYLLSSDAKYPMWAKYWVFQGMLKIGTYNEQTGTYNKRSKKTIGQFIDADPEIIAKCINEVVKYVGKRELSDEETQKLISSGSFAKLYTINFEKNKKALNERSSKTDGIWIKYNKETEKEVKEKLEKGIIPEYKKLCDSLQEYKTRWCTASESTAKDQICGGGGYPGGDFYVYYTKDQNGEYKIPRIAIRMSQKEIGEIRGVAESQNLEEGFEDIVANKLYELKLSEKEIKENMIKVDNMRKLTIINKKNTMNIELTGEELLFLHSNIVGFGWEKDPRIEKIQNSRGAAKAYDDLKKKIDTSELVDVIIKNNISIIKYEKDREIVLEVAKQNGFVLAYADESFRKDREIVLEAIKQNEVYFEYADESLKKDQKFVLEAIKQNGSVLRYVDKSFRKDPEIVLEAIKQKEGYFTYADESLRKDPEIVLEAIKQNGSVLAYADESLRKDPEIVLEAIKQNGSALAYADESLRKDPEIVLEAIKQDGYALAYVDKSFRKDPEIVLKAIKQDGYALKYADESLRKDREIVLEAIKQDGFALEYADESLRKDPEIVLEAIKQKVFAIPYADESLKNNREFVLEAIKQDGYALAYVDKSFRKDPEIVLEAIKQNAFALEYADESFRKDPEIVLEAIKQNGSVLAYADESLRKDPEIVLEAIKQNASALKYVDESLKNNREFVLEAIKQNGSVLKYVDESLIKDKFIPMIKNMVEEEFSKYGQINQEDTFSRK